MGLRSRRETLEQIAGIRAHDVDVAMFHLDPENTLNETGVEQRVIAFTVNDGALNGALNSAPGFRTVDVVSVNDAPVLTVPATQTILEDNPLVFSTGR